MTYGELKSAIATLIDRSDLTPVIPTIVELAVRGLERNCFWFQLSSHVFTCASGIGTSSLPPDFIQEAGFHDFRPLHCLSGSNLYPLTKADYVDLRDRQIRSPAYGRPLYYGLGPDLAWWPIPDDQYEITMQYYAHLGVPSSDTADNAWTTTAYDLTLYESLERIWEYVGDSEEQLKAAARKQKVLAQMRSQHLAASRLGIVRYNEF